MTNSHKRSARLAIGLMLGLVAAPCGLTFREWRQEKLDQELISALQTHRTPEALLLLKQGADPNVRLLSEMPPATTTLASCWSRLSKTLRGEKAAPSSGFPCLLWELGIESTIPPTRYRPKPPPEDPVLVGALLERGAEVDVQGEGESKETPLMLAVEHKYERVAFLLLAHHANPNAVDEEGRTPLILALECYAPSRALLSALLEHGADLNAQDQSGKTPLMVAVEHRRRAGTRFLLEHHAEVQTEDQSGWTALRFAGDLEDHRPDPSLIALLRNAGAREESQ